MTADEDRTECTFSNVMKVYNVFFMTPQLFVNNLRRNDEFKVNIDDFTLLVFDECHHTMRFDAYNNIMAFYRLKKFQSATSKPILPQVRKTDFTITFNLFQINCSIVTTNFTIALPVSTACLDFNE